MFSHKLTSLVSLVIVASTGVQSAPVHAQNVTIIIGSKTILPFQTGPDGSSDGLLSNIFHHHHTTSTITFTTSGPSPTAVNSSDNSGDNDNSDNGAEASEGAAASTGSNRIRPTPLTARDLGADLTITVGSDGMTTTFPTYAAYTPFTSISSASGSYPSFTPYGSGYVYGSTDSNPDDANSADSGYVGGDESQDGEYGDYDGNSIQGASGDESDGMVYNDGTEQGAQGGDSSSPDAYGTDAGDYNDGSDDTTTDQGAPGGDSFSPDVHGADAGINVHFH